MTNINITPFDLNVSSKQTIPPGWNMFSLSELSKRITVGIATEVKPYVTDQGVPIIRNQNIKAGFFDDSDVIFISNEFDKANKNKRVVFGDVIIVRTGSNVGQACVVPKSFENAQTFTTLIVRPSKELDPNYLSLHMNSYGIKEVERLSAGGGKPNLNAGFLKDYQILLPPLSEQVLIVSIINKWDRAITLTTEIIAQKELQKKWLMQQLLTGKKRLKGLKGFKGEWTELKFGDITSNFSRRNKDLTDAKVYSVTNTNGFVLQSEHFEREVAGDDLTNYKIIKKNEFAYNPARINVGSIAFFENEIGLISSLYVCFSTKKEILDYYLFQFLQLDHTKHRIGSLGEGGVRVYLWYDLFAKIKINLPPIEEQREIVKVLQDADKELHLLRQKLEKLKEQKKGLMQVLLTGKKRIGLPKNSDRNMQNNLGICG